MVRVDADGRLTVVLRAPLPLLLPANVAPPVAERATQVQRLPAPTVPAGSVSTSAAALTSLRPALLPAMGGIGLELVAGVQARASPISDRSATGAGVSVSVAVL